MARRKSFQSGQRGSAGEAKPVSGGANLRRLSLRVAGTLMLVLAALPRLHAAELAPLTLDDLFSTANLFGVTPSAPAWSPDSRYIAFTWNNAGLPQRSLWVASPDNSEPRQLGSATSEDGSVRDFAWLSGSQLLSLRGDALWSTTLEGEETKLAAVGPGATDLGVSPDGRMAAYRQDGNLWLFDVGERQAVAATDVGIPRLSSLSIGRYARPEREIGPGIWGGPTYAWSPDSKTIAVHYVDRRGMRKVPFPDYLAEDTEPNEVRRGYPGDPNEMRTVGLLNVSSGELRLLELENPTANQVVGFAWSPDGVLLLDLASDTAEDRWLYTVQPGSNDLKLIWHSNRPTRIYTSFASAWHPDGQRVLFLSDIEDRYGLFTINPAERGAEPRRLTDLAYDVLGAPTVVAPASTIYFAGNGVSPYERHAYRLQSGSAATRVTHMPGQNSAYPSPDGQHLAIVHSNDTSPPELYLAREGGEAERITQSPLPEFHERSWARARYVGFPSKIDDYTLHARILEPPNLDPERRYPVLFGPMYSNTVRNRWAGVYSLMQQLLVQKGYIVVQVDIRGSTGYGRDFREEFLVDFAGEDIEDIVSAADYLKTIPYVDPDRFGIWGSSYGGTLTIYSLLKKPGLFRAGVAGASAVDPYFFGTDDVAIVRRPDTHPDVFANQAVRFAANLEDHLLLIHGMQDQVVPFKTIAVFAEELIRQGKNFDFALAPGATHGWRREAYHAKFLFGKLLEHFDRHLQPAAGQERGDDDASD